MMQINYAILLLAILVVISFKSSDQFLKRIEVAKRFKELAFNSNFMQLYSSSKNDPSDMKKAERDEAFGVFNMKRAELDEAFETGLEGVKKWHQIESNFNEWDEVLSMDYTDIVIKESFKKDMMQLIIKGREIILSENTIPDVVAFSVKKDPMTPEVLKTTIEFFLKYDYYSQLACLITHQQNPPITLDYFENISGEQLTKLFEHLFMMNPEKLDLFFDPISTIYADAIVSLLFCEKCIPNVFNGLVKKIMLDSEEHLNNISSTVYENYLMRKEEVKSIENREYISRRNEELLFLFYNLYEKNNRYLEYDGNSHFIELTQFD